MSSISNNWRSPLLLGLVLVLAAGWFITARALHERSAGEASLTQRIQRLEQPAGEASGVALRRGMIGSGARPSYVPPSMESLSEGLAKAQREGEQQWQATEAHFAREPRNQAWGAPKESLLLQATLDSTMAELDRPEHMDVDCRRTQCRISAVFLSRSAAEDWAQIYIVGAGRTLTRAMMQVQPNDDGTAEVRIYGSP